MKNIIYVNFKKSGSKPVELLAEQEKIKQKYKVKTWYLQSDCEGVKFWDTYLHSDCIYLKDTINPPFDK